MKNIIISGFDVPLKPRSKEMLKGITIGDSINFNFFDGDFNGTSLLFIQPKMSVPSPRSMALIADRIETLFGLPVVFVLDKCPAYQRKRLIEKGVYFVVSDGYAFLPMLLANSRMRKSSVAKRLSPVAQYILLYHLQEESLEGKSAKNLQEFTPYSYPSIALGLTQLEDVGLCRRISDISKSKILEFQYKGRELWDKSQIYLSSPVDKRIFCDSLKSDEHFTVANLNALAHYTKLSAGSETMIAIGSKQLEEFETNKSLVHPNQLDGNVEIEVWKYPPVVPGGFNAEFVDRLSLALSLKDNEDARVENEVERLIRETIWKD